MPNYSEQHWLNLWQRIVAREDALKWYALIRQRYAEEHRKYHTWPHIEDCLRHFDAARHLAQNPDAVEMAILLHDIIYDPQRNDNEKRSAEFMLTISSIAGIDERFALRVSEIIEATVHTGHEINPDNQLACDIDLASLGYAWYAFAVAGEHIREEYKHVPDALFRLGRRRILKVFYDRALAGRLYYTAYFRSAYTAQARNNLARAIAELTTTP